MSSHFLAIFPSLDTRGGVCKQVATDSCQERSESCSARVGGGFQGQLRIVSTHMLAPADCMGGMRQQVDSIAECMGRPLARLVYHPASVYSCRSESLSWQGPRINRNQDLGARPPGIFRFMVRVRVAGSFELTGEVNEVLPGDCGPRLRHCTVLFAPVKLNTAWSMLNPIVPSQTRCLTLSTRCKDETAVRKLASSSLRVVQIWVPCAAFSGAFGAAMSNTSILLA